VADERPAVEGFHPVGASADVPPDVGGVVEEPLGSHERPPLEHFATPAPRGRKATKLLEEFSIAQPIDQRHVVSRGRHRYSSFHPAEDFLPRPPPQQPPRSPPWRPVAAGPRRSSCAPAELRERSR